jgi:hypothetical protein
MCVCCLASSDSLCVAQAREPKHCFARGVFQSGHIAIEGINALGHFAPSLVLGSADYLKAFEPHQLQALALLSLELHE